MLAVHAVVVNAPLALWTWIGATLVPILTAMIIHYRAPAWFKALANAFLTSVAALVVYALAHDGSFDVYSWLLSTASALFVAWAAYAGLWRQTAVKRVEQKLPGGIGAKDADHTLTSAA